MTGTLSSLGEGHHVIGHTGIGIGKHSVEINVRIKRAKAEPAALSSSSTPAPDPDLSRLVPTSKRLSNSTIRRGSWADVLNRTTRTNDQKGLSHGLAEVGTQTEAGDEAESLAGGCGDGGVGASSGDMEDYIRTIQKLHHVSIKLKEEVSRVRLAKDEMASNLLGIIGEKDRIIAACKSQSPLPVLSQPIRLQEIAPAHSESELSRYRSIIRGVRSLYNAEMEALKRRRVSPLPALDPRLDKFLKQFCMNAGEVGREGGIRRDGGDDGVGIVDPKSDKKGDQEDPSVSESEHISSFSSSGPGDKDIDNNSTQYLELPQR